MEINNQVNEIGLVVFDELILYLNTSIGIFVAVKEIIKYGNY